jgi:opacity protein-like surface antigen
LAKVAVQCSSDTFVVNQSLVLRINICGANRHLRQALFVSGNVKNLTIMKKTFFTTFLMTFSLFQSFGQISFGVKAGLNLSNVKNVGSTDDKARLGLNGGLLTEIKISKKFIVRPEVLYSIKGHKFPATAFNSGGILSLNYISIPLFFGFRPTDKFTILLGPEFSFLTNANSKFDGSNHDVSKNYRKFDFAIDLGATYTIIKSLGVELRYSYGFEDLVDVTYTDQNGNDIGKGRIGSNRVFQLGVFYKFSKK